MPVRGSKPKADGQKRFRGGLTHDWVEIPDKPFTGKVPVKLPAKRTVNGPEGPIKVDLTAETKAWWAAIRRMPHCVMWSESDWHYALATALVADTAFRGSTGAATELRQREKTLGTTADARRDLRIRYVDPETQKGPSSATSSSSSKANTAKKDQLAERRARRERVSSAS